MSIRLQQENGAIKEYRTSFGMGTIDPPSDGDHETLCGKKWPGDPGKKDECDHLDCAIWVTEKGFRQFGGLFIFVTAFWVLIAPWGIIIGLPFGLLSLYYYIKGSELKEFRDRGTIRGVGAYKL